MFSNATVDFLQSAARLAQLRERLPAYLEQQRWFTSKGQGITDLEIEVLPAFGEGAVITLLHLTLASGLKEVRVLPLASVTTVVGLPAHATIVEADAGGGGYLIDAVHLASFRESLYAFLASGETIAGPDGRLIAERGPLLVASPTAESTELPPQNSSNTVVIYRPDGFLKLFRKTEPGLHPDAELIGYLSADRGFDSVPPFGGALHYHREGDAEPSSLALMLGRVDHNGETWETMLGRVAAFAKTYRARGHERYTIEESSLATALRPADLPADLLADMGRETVDRVVLLGRRTAEMHLHFAAAADESMVPQDLGDEYWATAKTQLRHRLTQEQKEAEPALAHTLGRLYDWLDQELPSVAGGSIRVHGDYHLGQVLDTDQDVVIIDFEGEPLHSLDYRRRRHPAFKDVAGMLRSLHYAPYAHVNQSGETDAIATDGARAWYATASRLFLTAYLDTARDATYLPADAADRMTLLSFFLIDKALYELAYERASRPDWLQIPVEGIMQVGEMLGAGGDVD